MAWEIVATIVFIAILLFVSIKFRNNSYIGKDQFDERQEMIRKKAYKYSAMTMMFAGTIYFLSGAITKKQFLVEGVGGLLIALLGIGVFAIYSIFNDSFFSYRGQRGGLGGPIYYMIIVAVITIANGVSAVQTILKHELIKNGLLTSNVCQLALSVLFLLILISLGIKQYMNSREELG